MAKMKKKVLQYTNFIKNMKQQELPDTVNVNWYDHLEKRFSIFT